jgi:hypothetical protein
MNKAMPKLWPIYSLVLLIAALAWALVGFQERPHPLAAAGRDPMTLPEDYRQALIHYATIDRPDGVSRNLYISPQALAALERGEGFPERTLILIDAYDSAGQGPDGRLTQDRQQSEIHASERRTTWTLADMRTSAPSGDWNFAAFLTKSGAPFPENLNDCFSCHEAAAGREFTFTLPLIYDYLETGEVQYRFCNQPDREICRYR